MSDDAFAPESGPTVHEPVDLPLDFEAYFLIHHKTFRAFAAEMLGDGRAGDEIAHQVFVFLAAHWEEILESADPQREAEDFLAGAVMFEIHRLAREHLLAARLVEARRSIVEARRALDRIDEGYGLYAALAELRDRQFETFLLREVMGYTANFTAVVLGIHPRTVDHHHRRATAEMTATLTARRVLHAPAAGPRREGGTR